MFLKNHKATGIALGFILIIALGMQGVTPAQAGASMLQAGSVYRVSPGGTTSGTCGTDWSSPCDLQYAISLASQGAQIWVMEGTYYPDEGTGQTNDDRTSTFNLKDGIAIYGGFAGTETSLLQRDPVANITTLSGDIDQVAGNGANAYHVVTIQDSFLGIVVDGFTISGGNANGTDNFGGGMSLSHASPTLQNLIFDNNAGGNGGGLSGFYASPTLTDVIFRNNNTSIHGGGMYLQDSHPSLVRVTFSTNTAVGYGGGMAVFLSNPTLTDVTFDNNQTTGAFNPGGGMYTSDSTPVMNRVTFSNNRALDAGGGGMYNYASNLQLTNATFYNNYAYRRGGAMVNEASDPVLNNVTISGNTAVLQLSGGIANFDDSDPVIRNSILWGDSPQEVVNSDETSVPVFEDSIVQGGCPAGSTCVNILTSNPNLGSLDNRGGFTQTMAIEATSPAFDAGNSAVPGSGSSACAATDQRGFSRPQNVQCDLGAFEAYLITVTAEPKSMVYGTTEPTYTFQYSNLANGDTGAVIDTPPTCSVPGEHANVGIYTIVCSGGTDNVYTFYEYVDSTLTVSKATPSLSISNSPSPYSGTPQAAAVSPSVPGNVTNILTGGAAAQVAVGSYSVTANFTPTDTNNYFSLTGVSVGTFVIEKATPILSVSNSPVTYDGTSKAATVSPSVPGNVTNILTGGAAAQVNAGSYPVTANFVPTDTINYKTLTNASAGNFVIEKATPILSVSNSPVTYNGTSKEATVSSSVPGNVTNILMNGAAAQVDAGSYSVTANFVPTDTTNYKNLTGASAGTFVIQKATPILSVSNSPVPYNGAAQSATVSSSVPGSVTNILTGGAAGQTLIGSYPVTADFVPTDTANYISITNASAGTFTIQKADPVLSVSNSPVTYSGFPQSATVSSSVPGAISNILVGGSTSQTNAGTYIVTADFVPYDTTNYNSVTVAPAGNFIINKAYPILSLTNPLVEADGLPHSAIVSTLVPGTVSNVRVDGAVSQTAVGSYPVTANFTPSDTVNYHALLNAPVGTFVISPDVIPPDTQLNLRPAGLSGPDVSFTFSSADGTATFECQLDGGGFSACTSPKDYVGLSGGSHTFEVRGKDAYNNIDVTPAAYTWTVLVSSSSFSGSAIINSTDLYSVGGSSAGNMVNLGYFEQIGIEDTPSTYVTFQSSEAVYLGYRSFYLPSDIEIDRISSALLQVNINSSDIAEQTWTWSIYDWNSRMWIKLGDTNGVTPNEWNSIVFPLRDIRRVISSSGEIRIQLTSSGMNHNLKVDYEALHLTYRPVTVKPTLPAPSTPPYRPGIASHRLFR